MSWRNTLTTYIIKEYNYGTVVMDYCNTTTDVNAVEERIIYGHNYWTSNICYISCNYSVIYCRYKILTVNDFVLQNTFF